MPDDTGITLAEAKAQLAAWMTADAALASGAQSFSMTSGTNARSVTRADAAEIRRNIEFWDGKVRSLKSGGGIRVFGVIPP
jgi:hypothetical protein